jgi:hypothetical protein
MRAYAKVEPTNPAPTTTIRFLLICLIAATFA